MRRFSEFSPQKEIMTLHKIVTSNDFCAVKVDQRYTTKEKF
jgi:hypothetical protein